MSHDFIVFMVGGAKIVTKRNPCHILKAVIIYHGCKADSCLDVGVSMKIENFENQKTKKIYIYGLLRLYLY